jgi:GDP-D-mannose 3',5'-epimerase
MDYDLCVKHIKNVDYVFHLADVVGGIQYVFDNEITVFRNNIIINSNVLNACLTNNIENYIYIGTACSYPKEIQMSYEKNVVVEEDAYPANPESSYGWSKLIGEYEADLVKNKTKMNVGILRAHNVYGPNSVYDNYSGQVIPSLIRKCVLYPQEDFIIWGSGKQYRDFIFVDDVVDALILMTEYGMNKGVIQVGSGKPTTIKELAELIVKISGKKIDIKFDLNKQEGDKGRVANIQKAKKILNWQPKIDLYTGLQKVYHWIEEKINENRNS